MQYLSKEIFTTLATLACLLAYGMIYYGVYKDKIKPHAFSWLIWFILTVIVAAAQIVKGGGIGVIATALSALGCLSLAVAGFFRGKKNIRRSDYFSLCAALATIVLWYLTKDPLWSIIVIIIIYTIGFIPTFRKSWAKPYEEWASSYVVFALANALSVPAMVHINLTTVLMPAYRAIICLILALYLLVRRKFAKHA
jgi:hypothetical protein